MPSSFPSTDGASQVRRSEGAADESSRFSISRVDFGPPSEAWPHRVADSWGSALLDPAVAGLLCDAHLREFIEIFFACSLPVIAFELSRPKRPC
jgi:hypothetical protein